MAAARLEGCLPVGLWFECSKLDKINQMVIQMIGLTIFYFVIVL